MSRADIYRRAIQWHLMDPYSVYRNLHEASSALDRPVVTIGNFDGVHIGHQALFERVRNLADNSGVGSAAVTFSPHPVRFFRPDMAEFRLTTDPQKFALIGQCGLEATVVVDFDANFADLSPDAFVQRVLADGLDASHVVVGQDFAFGKDRAGTTADLVRLCNERDIGAEIAQDVTCDGSPVGSTRVRRELADAHIDTVTRLLGRPYRIYGPVVDGEKRGRKLGFPTANIASENPLLPPWGVYATSLHVPGRPTLQSVTNVGVRPTFDGQQVTVEAFVLSHDADEVDLDLYDEHVELDFWSYIRPELDFESPDELVAQIKRDVVQVRQYFGLQ